MVTNTFAPVVGGLERSIQLFTDELRRLGHHVLIVAPQFQGAPANETGVIRVPSIRHFRNTDYSIGFPIPALISKSIRAFKPDLVHSHHPFLLGDIALRISRKYELPLIFTYHTKFEDYLDYFPIHGDLFNRFIMELAVGYANFCDRVIAPSKTIHAQLTARGVHRPVHVVPTGINVEEWSCLGPRKVRRGLGIPDDAFVVGYVGRISPEKNLVLLAKAVTLFLRENANAHFLLIGSGPLLNLVKGIFMEAGLESRFHYAGVLEKNRLAQGYHALDAFVVTSHSETQGMTVLEAMACGVPVVVIKDQVLEEVVKDGWNGRVAGTENLSDIAAALGSVAAMSLADLRSMEQNARETVDNFSIQACTRRLLAVYHQGMGRQACVQARHSAWAGFRNGLKGEMDLLRNFLGAGEAAAKGAFGRLHKKHKHNYS